MKSWPKTKKRKASRTHDHRPPETEGEIAALEQLSRWAHSIGIDTRPVHFSVCLEIGFEKMAKFGGKQKA